MSNWIQVSHLDDIPQLGSRVVKTGQGDIAVFRTSTDEVFALRNACPHKQGSLAEGIVHGSSVTCPLHNWRIDLASGEAMGADEGCTNTFAAKVKDGMVFIQL